MSRVLAIAAARVGALLLFAAAIGLGSGLIWLFVSGHWGWGVGVILAAFIFGPEDTCQRAGGHDGPCDCAGSRASLDVEGGGK